MSLSSLSRESPKPTVTSTASRYAEHVNPQWVRLLDLLDMNMGYQRCVGAELWTDEEFVVAAGKVIADVHESTTFWTDALALGRRAMDI